MDPKKDTEAAILARLAGVSSLPKTTAESGGDIYDVFQSIAADDAMAASMGIQLPELTDAKAGALKAEIEALRSEVEKESSKGALKA